MTEQEIKSEHFVRSQGYDPSKYDYDSFRMAKAAAEHDRCAMCGKNSSEVSVCSTNGHSPIITEYRNRLYISYRTCEAKIQHDRLEHIRGLVGSMPLLLQDKSFKNYTISDRSDDPDIHALKMLKSSAVRAARDGSSIVIAGSTGIGKTHLAVSILHHAINGGHVGLFKTMPDLLQSFKNQLQQGTNKMSRYDELLRLVCECSVLVLDDFGSEKRSEWSDELIYMIINSRYLEKRQTIITTNYYTPNELIDRMGINGQRIVSRLCEMGEWVSAQAADHRMTMQHQRSTDDGQI